MRARYAHVWKTSESRSTKSQADYQDRKKGEREKGKKEDGIACCIVRICRRPTTVASPTAEVLDFELVKVIDIRISDYRCWLRPAAAKINVLVAACHSPIFSGSSDPCRGLCGQCLAGSKPFGDRAHQTGGREGTIPRSAPATSAAHRERYK